LGALIIWGESDNKIRYKSHWFPITRRAKDGTQLPKGLSRIITLVLRIAEGTSFQLTVVHTHTHEENMEIWKYWS